MPRMHTVAVRPRGPSLLAIALVAAFAGQRVVAQEPAYDFYPEFRRWLFSLPPAQRAPLTAVLEHYERRQREAGTAPQEIARRTELVRTRRPELEADFWNRFLTADRPAFTTTPNAFLRAVVAGRPPGHALDVGMGEGRNALYLATLGWTVTGIDPADKAVALARQRARALGLSIATHVVHDREFDVGVDRWDLIVLSWMPVNDAPRLVRALRPGGRVIFEGPRAWFDRNGLLEAFADLRVLHYEDVETEGDFFHGQRIDVLRLLAERPTTP
jgi:SAM-dependent methyltransferase